MYLFYCHVIVRGHNENKRRNLLEEDPGIVSLSSCRNGPFLFLVLLLFFPFFFSFLLNNSWSLVARRFRREY